MYNNSDTNGEAVFLFVAIKPCYSPAAGRRRRRNRRSSGAARGPALRLCPSGWWPPRHRRLRRRRRSCVFLRSPTEGWCPWSSRLSCSWSPPAVSPRALGGRGGTSVPQWGNPWPWWTWRPMQKSLGLSRAVRKSSYKKLFIKRSLRNSLLSSLMGCCCWRIIGFVMRNE